MNIYCQCCGFYLGNIVTNEEHDEDFEDVQDCPICILEEPQDGEYYCTTHDYKIASVG